MVLDGQRADAELVGDLLVALALAQPAEDFALALGDATDAGGQRVHVDGLADVALHGLYALPGAVDVGNQQLEPAAQGLQAMAVLGRKDEEALDLLRALRARHTMQQQLGDAGGHQGIVQGGEGGNDAQLRGGHQGWLALGLQPAALQLLHQQAAGVAERVHQRRLQADAVEHIEHQLPRATVVAAADGELMRDQPAEIALCPDEKLVAASHRERGFRRPDDGLGRVGRERKGADGGQGCCRCHGGSALVGVEGRMRRGVTELRNRLTLTKL
mmetsp:Transcript_17014/g.40515  ORF Transcript_17014/g.40515 Transcript_17014/m.40515 type:complete len:272 (-) Transcript_17014:450-1265(-)